MQTKQIKITHINMELTNRCNLKCPFCVKNREKYSFKKADFNIKWLDKIPVENLESFYICGTVGDPIVYPNLVEFIQKCYERNPDIFLSIHTNGTLHNSEWWKNLARILKDKSHCVTFGIDGLEDTYHIHRIGGNYNKVIENLKTFTSNGGRSVWQFIVFEYNEHQLVEASKKSRELGCDNFAIRKSFRFTEEYKRPTFMKHFLTRHEFSKLNLGPIICRIGTGEITILSDGHVIPCCHRVHQMVQKIDTLSLRDYTFEEILNDGYIQRVYNSVNQIPYCQNCRDKIESSDVGQFVLDYLENRKLIREQKKIVDNKI